MCVFYFVPTKERFHNGKQANPPFYNNINYNSQLLFFFHFSQATNPQQLPSDDDVMHSFIIWSEVDMVGQWARLVVMWIYYNFSFSSVLLNARIFRVNMRAQVRSVFLHIYVFNDGGVCANCVYVFFDENGSRWFSDEWHLCHAMMKLFFFSPFHIKKNNRNNIIYFIVVNSIYSRNSVGNYFMS